MLLALITERKKTVRTGNILQGKTQFSGHLFMSGIYNVGYCAMTWFDFRNVSSGEVLFSTDTARREAKWVHH